MRACVTELEQSLCEHKAIHTLTCHCHTRRHCVLKKSHFGMHACVRVSTSDRANPCCDTYIEACVRVPAYMTDVSVERHERAWVSTFRYSKINQCRQKRCSFVPSFQPFYVHHDHRLITSTSSFTCITYITKQYTPTYKTWTDTLRWPRCWSTGKRKKRLTGNCWGSRCQPLSVSSSCLSPSSLSC